MSPGRQSQPPLRFESGLAGSAAWLPGVLAASLSPLACPGAPHATPALRKALARPAVSLPLPVPQLVPKLDLVLPGNPDDSQPCRSLSPLLSSAETSCKAQLPPSPKMATKAGWC